MSVAIAAGRYLCVEAGIASGCITWQCSRVGVVCAAVVAAAVSGKRVLEVGCGPGLVATCLCRSGAGRVLLTDGDPQTLVNCLSNLSLNGHRDSTLLGSWQQAAGFVQQGQGCDSGTAAHQGCLLVHYGAIDWRKG